MADYIVIKQKTRIRNVQRARKPLSCDSVLRIAFYFPVNLRVLNSLILLDIKKASPQAQG